MKKLITVKLTHDEILEIINLITVRALGGTIEPEHKSAGKRLGKAVQLAQKKRGTAHD
tara:strand:- start:254 stop:427 length:174 start_codon:yes stop_codon:yes gene_type:complete